MTNPYAQPANHELSETGHPHDHVIPAYVGAPSATQVYAHPQVPYGPPPQRPPTGAMSWGMGFIAFIPLPGLTLLMAAIVLVAAYPWTKKQGVPLAIENARIAANWGLTIISSLALCAVYAVAISQVPEFQVGFYPFGWAVVALMVLMALHSFVTIIGTVTSRRGRVFRNALGIPFIRRPRFPAVTA